MICTCTKPTYRTSPGAAGLLGLLIWTGCAGAARAQSGAKAARPGDVTRGWRVFHAKHCVECHAIWGQGGRVGPDLGRTASQQQSGGHLAGVMWNHIPKMLGRMEQTGRPPTTLNRDEMSDLFALLFFARQLDDTGDARRGERVLKAKGCTECHALGSLEEGIGPDLTKWGHYANPIAWAQMMWEHAPMMEEAMKRSGIVWPKLAGPDIVDMLAYIRSVGGEGEREYLLPGDHQRGRGLFVEKGCSACHPGAGPDLATRKLPPTVGGLAVRMWNHSPIMASSMRKQSITRQRVSAQELADLLAYVLELSRGDRSGDPHAGAVLFEQKGCNQCHEATETANGVGPPVTELSRDAGPVDMAAAMWNHGGAMLERMTEAGVSWPVFDDDEMVDLLAFLKNGDGQ
ncbi:MAG: c-type cytochrome [Phycisphaerae bacterium]